MATIPAVEGAAVPILMLLPEVDVDSEIVPGLAVVTERLPLGLKVTPVPAKVAGPLTAKLFPEPIVTAELRFPVEAKTIPPSVSVVVPVQVPP